MKVYVLDLKNKTTEVFLSLDDAAKKFQTTSPSLRVSCCETARFFKEERAVPKYYNGKVFLYEKDKTRKNLAKIENLPYRCEICYCKFDKLKNLASHIQLMHKISTEEYTIQKLYKNISPKCEIANCEKKPRYSNLSFKKYCSKHARFAMVSGGAKGGSAAAWNKGLTKETDERVLHQSLNLKGKNNPFYGKKHDEASIKKIKEKKKLTSLEVKTRLNKFDKYYSFSYDFKDYFKKNDFLIKATCKICGYEEYKKYKSIEQGSLCSKCFPFTTSRGEAEIGTFIESLGISIERNNRNLIKPLELDIWIPDANLAIEYHGLYWHMDRGQEGFNKKLHKIKSDLCRDSGVRLIQIFSDEWNEKPELVKSMIKHALNLTEQKFDARKCELVLLTNNESKDFFNLNHISGHVREVVCFALKYNGKIISALSLRKPFHKKYSGAFEIARFANEKNSFVRGGFTKLLSAAEKWCIENGVNKIISYCDLSTGTGKVYQINGFSQVKTDNSLNYWYTDGIRRYGRFKFRAQPNKSESEVAKENQVHKIYGCGNLLFEKQLCRIK